MSASGTQAAAPEESATGRHMGVHERARAVEREALTVPELRQRAEWLERRVEDLSALVAVMWEHFPQRGDFEEPAAPGFVPDPMAGPFRDLSYGCGRGVAGKGAPA